MTDDQKKAFYMAIGNYEGFRSQSYYCPAGYLTIGFGHRIRDNERQRFCTARLTFKQAYDLLVQDFDDVFNFLAKQDFILQENELFALADLAFNVGCNTLASRPLFQRVRQYSEAINNHEHTKADALSKYISERFLAYCHYKRNGKVYTSSGLLARRRFDSRLWLGDLYILK